MDIRILFLSLLCCAALVIAGCTSPAPGAVPETPVPETTAAVALTPMNAMGCVVYDDCVPAQCCHPASCINKVAQKDCTGIACTMSCEGPLDCGAGTCGCVQGTCSVVPAQQDTITVTPPIRIEASPQRYSPFMSSTPGVGLAVNAPGIDAGATDFLWTASYGTFLAWNPPDYKVTEIGSNPANHGEKLYWSFIDKPSSTDTPVRITVTAKDPQSGAILGNSTLTLAWDGDYAVTVQGIA
jgi:hypothetical protein